jgi:hypothetical protein
VFHQTSCDAHLWCRRHFILVLPLILLGVQHCSNFWLRWGWVSAAVAHLNTRARSVRCDHHSGGGGRPRWVIPHTDRCRSRCWRMSIPYWRAKRKLVRAIMVIIGSRVHGRGTRSTPHYWCWQRREGGLRRRVADVAAYDLQPLLECCPAAHRRRLLLLLRPPIPLQRLLHPKSPKR